MVGFTPWPLDALGKVPLIATEQRAGWAPVPVCKFWNTNCLAPAMNQTLDCPVHSLVTTETKLS